MDLPLLIKAHDVSEIALAHMQKVEKHNKRAASLLSSQTARAGSPQENQWVSFFFLLSQTHKHTNTQ